MILGVYGSWNISLQKKYLTIKRFLSIIYAGTVIWGKTNKKTNKQSNLCNPLKYDHSREMGTIPVEI